MKAFIKLAFAASTFAHPSSAQPVSNGPPKEVATDVFEDREVSQAAVLNVARKGEGTHAWLSEVRSKLKSPLDEMAALSGRQCGVSRKEVEQWKKSKIDAATSPEQRKTTEEIASAVIAALNVCQRRTRAGNSMAVAATTLLDVISTPLVPFMLFDESIEVDSQNRELRRTLGFE